MEQKLNQEINGTAIDILKAVGFTYEYTDLDSLCRKLGLATFADFQHVNPSMIAGAGLGSKILERKLAQLCAQCTDVDTYKRWRRRSLRYKEISAAEVAATQRARAEQEERHARIQQWNSHSHHRDESLRGLLLRLREA